MMVGIIYTGGRILFTKNGKKLSVERSVDYYKDKIVMLNKLISQCDKFYLSNYKWTKSITRKDFEDMLSVFRINVNCEYDKIGKVSKTWRYCPVCDGMRSPKGICGFCLRRYSTYKEKKELNVSKSKKIITLLTE